ncbi:MAG: glutamate-5-semialdehyde dehydrogenase [Acidimicrobiales bacterium]
MSPHPTIPDLARRAKAASRLVARSSTDVRNDALVTAADLLQADEAAVLAANEQDLATARDNGVSSTLLDRLQLTSVKIAGMADGLRQVATLPDPVGEVLDGWVRPNGLKISRVRMPLGVVAIIYEMRPNVTSDAAALCLKSGNAAFLRGSSAAISSNTAIETILRSAYEKVGLPADALVLVPDTTREGAVTFMRQRGFVDCLIPRGGPALIQSILENATVPYVIDGDGNCHVYVDRSADLSMATNIVVNAKMQRPSVCNAMESLVVHADVASKFLPAVADALDGVDLVGDERAHRIAPRIEPVEDGDYGREFLELKASVRVVDSLDEAIEHVNEYSSGHSEAIVTEDLGAAEAFLDRVDAAAVLVNASTRFVDGEEFGFGAEIGISTQKLHARGPMGLRQLTSAKYVVRGDGQVRS